MPRSGAALTRSIVGILVVGAGEFGVY